MTYKNISRAFVIQNRKTDLPTELIDAASDFKNMK